jgi:hypothetical protein
LRVRTLYFARLKELTGREAEELEVPWRGPGAST